MTACPKCGGSDIADRGVCRPCHAAWAKEYRKRPERQKYVKTWNGSAAAREVRARYAQKKGPARHLRPGSLGRSCSACGSNDRNSWGKCRPCDAKNAAAKRARNPELREIANLDRKKRQGRYMAARSAEEKINDARRSFAKHLRQTFGLTPEDWARMFNEQNRCCSGCGDRFESSTKVVVDHCHSTGRVRGLLCHPCNVSIGFARDSAVRLRALADYLDRTAAQ